MDARLIGRPLLDLFGGRTKCLLSLNTAARRYESSARRSKHRLNIKPDVSFISNNSQRGDEVIFNPPSSAPSVYHTPLLFMPKEDKRKGLFSAVVAKRASQSNLPPIIEKFKPLAVRHHLKEEDIAEIRRLRTTDPDKWTTLRLGKKFNCASKFVMMICEAPEKKEKERQKLEATMARWGPRKTKAWDDRQRRIELALKDM